MSQNPIKWLPVRKDAVVYEVYHHYLDNYVTVKFSLADPKSGCHIKDEKDNPKLVWINCIKIPRKIDPTGISNTEFYWTADKVPYEWREFLLKTPEAHQYF